MEINRNPQAILPDAVQKLMEADEVQLVIGTKDGKVETVCSDHEACCCCCVFCTWNLHKDPGDVFDKAECAVKSNRCISLMTFTEDEANKDKLLITDESGKALLRIQLDENRVNKAERRMNVLSMSNICIGCLRIQPTRSAVLNGQGQIKYILHGNLSNESGIEVKSVKDGVKKAVILKNPGRDTCTFTMKYCDTMSSIEKMLIFATSSCFAISFWNSQRNNGYSCEHQCNDENWFMLLFIMLAVILIIPLCPFIYFGALIYKTFDDLKRDDI